MLLRSVFIVIDTICLAGQKLEFCNVYINTSSDMSLPITKNQRRSWLLCGNYSPPVWVPGRNKSFRYKSDFCSKIPFKMHINWNYPLSKLFFRTKDLRLYLNIKSFMGTFRFKGGFHHGKTSLHGWRNTFFKVRSQENIKMSVPMVGRQ